MEYNSADQLTRWPGMRRYEYNNTGDLVRVTNDVTNAETASYTYTPAGLLNTASYNGRTLTNTWDANANRVEMTANGQQYQFTCDTTAGIPAVIEEDTSQNVVYYIREPNGELIAHVFGTDMSYYHFDELGSTRIITRGSTQLPANGIGNITDKYAYDAYGSLISHEKFACSVCQPYQYIGQLGYYTHYQETNFSLLELGVRQYDPATSSFTQMDMRKDGLNWYVYSWDNPTVITDPTGLFGYVPGYPLERDVEGGLANVRLACAYGCLKRVESAALRLQNEIEWGKNGWKTWPKPINPKVYPNVDMIYHCWSGCEGSKCIGNGPGANTARSILESYIDQLVTHGQYDPNNPTQRHHLDANHKGIELGKGKGDCWKGCWKWWAATYGYTKVPMQPLPIKWP